MGKKKNDDLAGTVEGEARDFFEREKAAYEERTGEKVLFEPPAPLTRTPIVRAEAGDKSPETGDESSEIETPAGEGE